MSIAWRSAGRSWVSGARACGSISPFVSCFLNATLQAGFPSCDERTLGVKLSEARNCCLGGNQEGFGSISLLVQTAQYLGSPSCVGRAFRTVAQRMFFSAVEADGCLCVSVHLP